MSEPADDSTAIWDQLAEHIEAFSAAWDRASSPPSLAEYVPRQPAALRRLSLVELVKLDLERRWPNPEWRKTLEQFAREWPELVGPEGLSADLIYEECQVRRRHGETFVPGEYLARFPQQAERLRGLFAIDDLPTTRSVGESRSAVSFEPGEAVDDFDLLARLGQGAFATVYLARQRSIGRLVAVKISLDRGTEARTMARLDHPHIVRVHDQRRLSDRELLLVYMQYLPGGTLRDVIDRVRQTRPEDRDGRLLLSVVDEQLRGRGVDPPRDSLTRHMLARLDWPGTVCWLGCCLAAALEHAHLLGVLHRDVKPANVLLGPEASPSLADFNVSSLAGPEALAQGCFGGTLAYMSPEQLAACLPQGQWQPDMLDARSDVYSLGVLLWEVLTGERPFCDDGASAISAPSLGEMLARRHAPLPAEALARVPANCPPGMVERLQQCLLADRDARIGSARLLRRQLELCRRPAALELLGPGAGGWVSTVRKAALPWLVAAALAPNLAFSALNILYNSGVILPQLTGAELRDVFQRLLVTINPLLYALGISTFVVLAWPVAKALHVATQGRSIPADAALAARRRALLLGDHIAWISGAEWFMSGFVFPAWLHWSQGLGAGIGGRTYAHFVASNSICGLLAATMAFFSVSYSSCRVLLPPLLDRATDDLDTQHSLQALSRRIPIYTYLAWAGFPLALIVVPLVRTESRLAFVVLGLIGLACSGLAIFMARKIQGMIAALRQIAAIDDERRTGR